MTNLEKTLKSNNIDRTEGSILSSLWKKILMDLNIVDRMPALIHNYVERDSDSKSVHVKKKSKSSITKDVTSDAMTWKVFINLMINLLRVKKMKFTVTLEFSNGEKSIHSVDVKTK